MNESNETGSATASREPAPEHSDTCPEDAAALRWLIDAEASYEDR